MSPGEALQHAIACRDEACFIWPHARDTHGRGQIRWNRQRRQVHPLVCEAVHGPRPTLKHEVSHLCDNGRGGCVNGAHLRWATRAENAARRTDTRRGRKLTEKEVLQIRAWKAVSRRTKHIADHYGVSADTVRDIASGRRWWWLP